MLTDAKKDPLAGVLTNEEFMPLWEAGPADKAKSACWEPAEKHGNVDSVLHFSVKIDAAGKVVDVGLLPHTRRDQPDELLKCVSDEIRKMRFAARSQPATGVVQAAKPGAFAEPKKVSFSRALG